MHAVHAMLHVICGEGYMSYEEEDTCHITCMQCMHATGQHVALHAYTQHVAIHAFTQHVRIHGIGQHASGRTHRKQNHPRTQNMPPPQHNTPPPPQHLDVTLADVEGKISN
jgi:hypothetical protein